MASQAAAFLRQIERRREELKTSSGAAASGAGVGPGASTAQHRPKSYPTHQNRTQSGTEQDSPWRLGHGNVNPTRLQRVINKHTKKSYVQRKTLSQLPSSSQRKMKVLSVVLLQSFRFSETLDAIFHVSATDTAIK